MNRHQEIINQPSALIFEELILENANRVYWTNTERLRAAKEKIKSMINEEKKTFNQEIKQQLLIHISMCEPCLSASQATNEISPICGIAKSLYEAFKE